MVGLRGCIHPTSGPPDTVPYAPKEHERTPGTGNRCAPISPNAGVFYFFGFFAFLHQRSLAAAAYWNIGCTWLWCCFIIQLCILCWVHSFLLLCKRMQITWWFQPSLLRSIIGTEFLGMSLPSPISSLGFHASHLKRLCHGSSSRTRFEYEHLI